MSANHQWTRYTFLCIRSAYVAIKSTTVLDATGHNKWFPDWKPIMVLCPADMKMAWNATVGKGGAAKQKEHFCLYCLQMSRDFNAPNKEFCESLTEDHMQIPFNDMKWECMHQEFMSKQLIAMLRQQLTSAISPEVKESHAEILLKTRLEVLEDKSDTHKYELPMSIDFKPQSLMSSETFFDLLMEKAWLWKISDWLTIEDLRCQLKDRQLQEQLLQYIMTSLQHAEPKSGLLYLIEQVVPCILHLENHTLIKNITMLL